MSTSTAFPSELETPQDVYIFEPSDALELRLCELGKEKWARRVACCGEIRPRKCPEGHIDRRMKKLCQRKLVCVECAINWSVKITEEWKQTLVHAMTHLCGKCETDHIHGNMFTFLEIVLPARRSRDSITATLKKVERILAANLEPEEFESYFKRPVAFVPREDNLIVRFLILSVTRTPEQWLAMFPEAKALRCSSYAVDRLLYVFAEHLVAPCWHKYPNWLDDPIECAEQEVLFEGVHMLANVGIHKDGFYSGSGEEPSEESEEEDFFVEDESPTKKSVSKDHCQTCGKRLTQIARYYAPSWAAPQLLDWDPISDPSPPPG